MCLWLLITNVVIIFIQSNSHRVFPNKYFLPPPLTLVHIIQIQSVLPPAHVRDLEIQSARQRMFNDSLPVGPHTKNLVMLVTDVQSWRCHIFCRIHCHTCHQGGGGIKIKHVPTDLGNYRDSHPPKTSCYLFCIS